MCLHCIGKVSNCSIKSCGRSWSAHKGTIYAYTKALLGKYCLSSHSCHFVKNYFSEPNSFMHMFNVLTLYRKSIKLFHQKLWQELMGPCMAYNSISIKPYIKSHLELQREITLIELAPSPYFLSKKFVLHIWTCLQGLMKIQQWLLKILRKQSVTDGRTTWKQYTPYKQSLRGV